MKICTSAIKATCILFLARHSNLFQNSILDRVKHCSRYKSHRKLIYKCKQFDMWEINYNITVHMMEDVCLESMINFYVVVNPGKYHPSVVRISTIKNESLQLFLGREPVRLASSSGQCGCRRYTLSRKYKKSLL